MHDQLRSERQQKGTEGDTRAIESKRSTNGTDRLKAKTYRDANVLDPNPLDPWVALEILLQLAKLHARGIRMAWLSSSGRILPSMADCKKLMPIPTTNGLLKSNRLRDKLPLALEDSELWKSAISDRSCTQHTCWHKVEGAFPV